MSRRPRLVALALAVLAAAPAAACQKEADTSKVTELEAKLTALDARLVKLEGFLKPYLDQPPPPPPPPEPDPLAVYAVPIDGAAYKGPAVAQVTIVEAFEFA